MEEEHMFFDAAEYWFSVRSADFWMPVRRATGVPGRVMITSPPS